MLQPPELIPDLSVELSNGVLSTTHKVWSVLTSAEKGDIDTIKNLGAECEELLYAQYNYTPPVFFAVCQGHTDLVRYLLSRNAHDPDYRIYPFLESLETLAGDRGFTEIENLLRSYSRKKNAVKKFKGDNGRIIYPRTNDEQDFEKAVYDEDIVKTKAILTEHPEFAKKEDWFWGEGILLFAAKENNREMIDLLMSFGAKVPDILKWTQFYYFEHDEGAPFMLEKGMNPNTRSWLNVTILHDMAQKGNIPKAELLLRHGANIDPVDDVYKSTPLGLAAKWGHIEMVKFLLEQGADPLLAGAPWSTPLAWARRKDHKDIEKLLM